jgi:hypothetical protein
MMKIPRVSSSNVMDLASWGHVFSFLPFSNQCRLERVEKAMRKCILGRQVPPRALELKKAFEGILNFPPLDRDKLYQDPAYAKESLLKMIKIIKSIPEFEKIWIENNKDFTATAQEIKDRDLLAVFTTSLPDDVLIEVKRQGNITNQARFLRNWLEHHPNQFAEIT